ncbi:MAG: XRE family transcriptional regulator [Hahellaceae bacterium]|nr:XRE family transcriptional regulator [Hahellaceae bacterium]
MKYLKNFPRHLTQLMQDKGLSDEEVAALCSVDVSVVQAWLMREGKRCYPVIDNLIDLCLKTGSELDLLLDLEREHDDQKQLRLPGLTFLEENDLGVSLELLHKEIDKVMPTEEELELLKRFRRSDPENRKLIIQLMN